MAPWLSSNPPLLTLTGMCYTRPIWMHVLFPLFLLVTSAMSPISSRWLGKWDDLEKAYRDNCERTCDADGTLLLAPKCRLVILEAFCFPCDCDDDCHMYGTCCPLDSNNTQLYKPHGNDGVDNNVDVNDYTMMVTPRYNLSNGMTISYLQNTSKQDQVSEDKDFHEHVNISDNTTLSSNMAYLDVHNVQSSTNDESRTSTHLGERQTSSLNPYYTVSFADRISCRVQILSTKMKFGTLMVDRCFSGWVDNETRQACESPTFDSMESIVAYSDIKSGLSFTNVYCAICNFFEPYPTGVGSHSWSYKIDCASYHLLYAITREVDFINAAFQINCWIYDVLPEQTKDGTRTTSGNRSKLKLKRCPKFYIHQDIKVDSCPESTDSELKRLCEELDSHNFGYRVRGYRNIYCAGCNKANLMCSIPTYGGTDAQIIPPIQLLFRADSALSYRRVAKTPHKKCNDSQWETDKVGLRLASNCERDFSQLHCRIE